MKSLLTTLGILAAATTMNANTFTFTTTYLNKIDHREAYTWGMNLLVPEGQEIKGATLTIRNIWDWKVEEDRLFVNLLDDPKAGVNWYLDNTADNVIADYFLGQGTKLFEWSDPVGGIARGFDLIYTFSASDVAALTAYVANGHPAGKPAKADFGFSFDPDCHYGTDGVTFVVKTPDGGSTLALLGLALCGLAFWRRRN